MKRLAVLLLVFAAGVCGVTACMTIQAKMTAPKYVEKNTKKPDVSPLGFLSSVVSSIDNTNAIYINFSMICDTNSPIWDFEGKTVSLYNADTDERITDFEDAGDLAFQSVIALSPKKPVYRFYAKCKEYKTNILELTFFDGNSEENIYISDLLYCLNAYKKAEKREDKEKAYNTLLEKVPFWKQVGTITDYYSGKDGISIEVFDNVWLKRINK